MLAKLQAGAGPAAEANARRTSALQRSVGNPEVIGQTGPVAPGLCGEARIALEGEKGEGEPTAWALDPSDETRRDSESKSLRGIDHRVGATHGERWR